MHLLIYSQSQIDYKTRIASIRFIWKVIGKMKLTQQSLRQKAKLA